LRIRARFVHIRSTNLTKNSPERLARRRAALELQYAFAIATFRSCICKEQLSDGEAERAQQLRQHAQWQLLQQSQFSAAAAAAVAAIHRSDRPTSGRHRLVMRTVAIACNRPEGPCE